MKNKKQLILISISLFLFIVSYWACRYPLFALHGTDDGTGIVAVIGGVVLVLSYLFKWKTTMIFVPFSLIISLVIATILQNDSIAYPGGSDGSIFYSSNQFHIWVISFLALIIFSISYDIYLRLKKNKQS